MRVVLTELFRDESKQLGLTKDAALDVINRADRSQEETYDGLALRFFMKGEEKRSSYLIVVGHTKNNKLQLDLPFRVPSSIFPNIDVLEPLMVLQLLADRCGLVIEIGSRLGRFIYKENVPLTQKETRIVNVHNPSNHPFLLNSYFKVVGSNGGSVAKCALVFCIDRFRCAQLLSSADIKMKRQEFVPVTRILSEKTIDDIVRNSKKHKDRKKRYNIVELGLSLAVIGKIMGKRWYTRVLRKFEPGEQITNRDYRRLVRSNRVHPLSEALWGGMPRRYIRLIYLAYFLNQLWRRDDSNILSEKIKELQQYSFIHAYYDLKVAASFDRRSMPVFFIRSGKELKTPDFRIDSHDGFAYAECKRKDSPSLEIDSLIDAAALQIEEHNGPGIIFVEMLGQPDHKSLNETFDRVAELLHDWKKVSLLVVTSEEYREELDMVALGTKAWPIQNRKAQIELPKSIMNAALFQDPISWVPLSQAIQLDT